MPWWIILVILGYSTQSYYRHPPAWNTTTSSRGPAHRRNSLHQGPRQLRHSPVPFDDSNLHCRVGAQDVPCSPPFENVAQFKPIHTTSNCGTRKIQRLCHSDGTCQVCDRLSKTQQFSPVFLTDGHQPRDPTCWSSGLAHPGGLDQAVNLTLSLGKRFEVSHISILPCLIGRIPDSIAIFKSSDFGQTWRPWHYFSTDCYRAFGLPTTEERNTQITMANLQEALCVALQPHEEYLKKQFRRRRSMQLMHASRWNTSNYSDHPMFDVAITFSTTLGRPAQRPWSPALVDWMTMTDVRISLMRFPPPGQNDYSEPVNDALSKDPVEHRWPRGRRNTYRNYWDHAAMLHPRMENQWYRSRLDRRSPNFSELRLPSLDTAMFPNASTRFGQTTESAKLQRPVASSHSEPDVLTGTEFYAIADLRVGGWCKCNGHAKECVARGADGRVECACEHNTEGTDCERCRPGYMDLPWDRASVNKANACTQCDCNLHSNECRFSNALYLMSNRVSGGVCENCQHNTAGRHCQHCAEGFYRDWTKPPSHEQVCLPCRCHPIGSVIRHDCDRRSGQCRCKQGVTGLTCDRCQEGYHQTRSPTNPCTKDFPGHLVALAHAPAGVRCLPCDTNKERIRLKKFCRKHAIIQATFISREIHNDMARFEMHVLQVWRLSHDVNVEEQPVYWPISQEGSKENIHPPMRDAPKINIVPVWVRLSDLRCKCPEIELGITYLIVTDFEGYSPSGRREILFTSKTALLPWRPSWKRRLVRFQRRQARGACDRLQDVSKLNTKDTNELNAANWMQSPYAHQPYQDHNFAAIYRSSDVKQYRMHAK